MPTRFDDWLRKNRKSDKDFAEMLNGHLAQVGKRPRYSYRTVEAWRYGRSIPRKDANKAINILTDGEVGAVDFVEDAV
jgi:hypothetical protein